MLNEEKGAPSSALPDWVNETLDDAERASIEAALAEDESLRDEAAFVGRVRAARPEPPPDLVARIRAALDAERSKPLDGRRGVARSWRWSAAAVLVLALGTAAVWQSQRGGAPALPFTEGPLVPDSWLLDDGFVAGGLVLDELSDEALGSLLAELER